MEESCYKPVLRYSNYIIFRICIMLRRLFKRMGIIWKCQPVTWCSCIDLYCCIHESNKQKIMDVLFPYDLHVLRNIYSDRIECHHKRKSIHGRYSSIPRQWFTAYRCSILSCTGSYCRSALC